MITPPVPPSSNEGLEARIDAIQAGAVDDGSLTSSKLATFSDAVKIQLINLADAVLQAVASGLDPTLYQGTWVPATDTPTIPVAAGNTGKWYVASAAGTATGNAAGTYAQGDRIVSNGTVWLLLPAPPLVIPDGYVTAQKLAKSAATRIKISQDAINEEKLSTEMRYQIMAAYEPVDARVGFVTVDGKVILAADEEGKIMFQGVRISRDDVLTEYPQNTSNIRWGVVQLRDDGLYDLIIGVRETGELVIGGGEVRAGGSVVLTQDDEGVYSPLAIAPFNVEPSDSLGSSTFWIKDANGVWINQRVGYNGKGRRKVYQMADINHIVSYGQSNSREQDSAPALTTTPSTRHLMPNSYTVTSGGTLNYPGLLGPETEAHSTEYRAGLFTSFQAFYEGGSAENGETMFAGLLAGLDSYFSTTRAKFLVSGAGVGGFNIQSLAQGTWPYLNLIYQVTQAKAICDAQGLTYKVPMVLWIQGESNQNTSTYGTLLATLADNLNTDIKAITGQTEDILLFVEQVTRTGDTPVFVDKEILRAHEDQLASGRIYLQSARYHITMTAHYTNHGKRWRGCHFGKAVGNVLFNSQEWEPVRPKSYTVDGNNLYLRFHVPVKPLQFATGQNNPTLLTYKGFEATNLNGVTLIADDLVKLTVSSGGWNGVTLKYAQQSTPSIGGNLCDSDATVAPYNNASSVPYPLQNWCVEFEMTITV